MYTMDNSRAKSQLTHYYHHRDHYHSHLPSSVLTTIFHNNKMSAYQYCRGNVLCNVSKNSAKNTKQKNPTEKACNQVMTFKDTQGYRNCCYYIDCISLSLIMACCDNCSILHQFQNSTTSAVYLTARDLEKSFIFDNNIAITSHIHFPIYLRKEHCS